MTTGACLKKHSTLENSGSLQVTCWSNDDTTNMYGCKMFEKQYALNGNIYQIRCRYATALLRNIVYIEVRLAATTLVK